MAIPSFIFGGDTGETPQTIAEKRRVASLLLGNIGAPKNIGEGFQALANGLASRWNREAADEAEAEGRSGAQDMFRRLITGQGGAPTPSYDVASIAPQTASDATAAMAGVPSGDTAGYIRSGLVNRGLPEHVADAFLLNFQDESGLNPGINEAQPLVPGSRGGYGLYQLTGPRRVAYEQFAAQRGVDPSDVDAQLDFLMSELQGPEAKAAQSILSAQDTPTAAAAIVNNFLRPAEEHRAAREARYLGGGTGQPVQVAQGPDMATLMEAASNPFIMADPGMASVVNSMLQQQMQMQDPRYQQQLQAGQLGIERARLEIDALRNKPPPLPGAPKTEKMYDPETGREQVMQWDDNAGQWVPLGGVAAPKEPLVNVMPSVGAPPSGYQNVFDEEGRLVRQEMIEGGPAWLEAQAAEEAAAVQQGAQIASDIEGAEKTLMSTRNVLDILDNTEGQPTTGTLSRPFAMLSNTPAGRIRSYVSTLQSGVALGAMQRLKEASSTGATGFGALSEPELNLLISDIGALDPDNTEPDIFRQTVQRIENRAKRVVADIRKNVSPDRIQELGLQEFLDAFDPPAPNQSTVDPTDIDALLELYR